MPDGTDDLRKLLREASARLASANGDAPAPAAPPAPKPPPARKPAAAKKAPAAKPAATKPAAATKAAATTKAAASRVARPRPVAPVVAVVSVPATPVSESEPPAAPPPVDLDAFDATHLAPVSAPPPLPPSPPPPPVSPPQWQPPASPAPPPAYAPYREEKRRGKAVVIGAVVAGLALAAGGAGVLVATMGGGPSKAEYIKKADAACATANAPVVAIAKPTSYPELATAGGVVVTSSRAQVDALQRIERPGGADGAAAQAFITSLGGAAGAAQQLQDAANAKDDAATIAGTHALGAAFNDTKAKAAAFGLTACGAGMVGGVDTLYAGSSGVVKTAYVAKADTLCRTAARAMDNVALPRNGTGREFARFLNAIFAVGDKLLADVKALPVAPGDEATVAAILGAQEQVSVKSRDLASAAQAEDESRFAAADRALTPLVTAADAKWDAYGLTICGSNFGEY